MTALRYLLGGAIALVGLVGLVACGLVWRLGCAVMGGVP